MPKAKEEDVAVPALPPTEEEKAAHAAFDVAMRNIVMDMDCACSATRGSHRAEAWRRPAASAVGVDGVKDV